MEEPQVFQGPPLGRRDLLTLLLPGVINVLVPLGVGVHHASVALARYGPVAAEARSRPYFIASVLLLLLFLLAVLARLHRARQWLIVQDDGVVVRRGLRSRFLPWTHILALRLHPDGTRLKATLHLSDGRRLTLPDLEDTLAAVVALQQRRARSLLPKLQRRWQQGEFIPFGPLSLSRHGLHYQEAGRTWKHLRRVQIADGDLVIEFHQFPAWRIPIAKVLDLHILLLWIERRGLINTP